MAPSKPEELKINATLYEAIMSQDDANVINICRRIPKGPLHTLSIHQDTVLHVAVYHKKQDLALHLLDMVPSCDYYKLTWRNSGGNTILHETGTNNHTVKFAEEVLRRAPMLLNAINKEGETALFYAARHGKTKIYKFLRDEVGRANGGPDLKTFLRRGDKFNILHIAILSRNFLIAHDIAKNHKELITEKDADDMTALQLLSTIQPEFHPKSLFRRMIFGNLTKEGMFPFINHLKKEKHACEWALKIAELLIKEDNSWKKTESWINIRGSKFNDFVRSTSIAKPEKNTTTAPQANYQKADTPLLLATRHNSTEIVRKILKIYPQAVEHVDKDGRNILHLAILYRRHEIIKIVEELEYPLERLTGKLDKDYNTLLHMVGQKGDEEKDDVRHPAQELKDDQHLYEKVKKLTRNLDMHTRNANEKTPLEVFYETNDPLRAEAKKWMCENATSCSIVAVLIATVAFTSAYTLPGGTDKNGHPVLRHKTMFLLFTVADAISLSSALTSVIVFLNVVTSPFRFKDFTSHLYGKQLTAVILLIISVAMMMVAFLATLILTIRNEETWSDMTLYGVSLFPVIVFVYSNISENLNIIKEFYWVFKKMMKNLVMGFHKIWHYKPQSTCLIDRTVYLASRSPV